MNYPLLHLLTGDTRRPTGSRDAMPSGKGRPEGRCSCRVKSHHPRDLFQPAHDARGHDTDMNQAVVTPLPAACARAIFGSYVMRSAKSPAPTFQSNHVAHRPVLAVSTSGKRETNRGAALWSDKTIVEIRQIA